jgi:single-stranded DNA-binding protein
MENIVLEGKLIKLLDLQQGVSTRGAWKKQEFILETEEQYPKKVCIACWGERVEDITKYSPGSKLKVSVNIESREWNNKWFTDIKAWRIETMQDGVASPAQAQESPTPDGGDITGISFSDDEGDDLPF